MKTSSPADNNIAVGQSVLYPSNFTQSPCLMCGKCCNNDWNIEMDAVEFKRYNNIFSKSNMPKKLSSHLMEINVDGRMTYRLTPEKGRCIFLLPDNKCHIHSSHGPETKSRTCNRFPLAVDTYSPKGMHLKTSFICPSILDSLLSADKIQINSIEWKNDFICSGSVNLCDTYNVSWDSFFSLIDTLSSLFLKEPFNVEQNLIIAGLWVSNLFSNIKSDNIMEFEANNIDHLSRNKKNYLAAGDEFLPQYAEQMTLVANIASVLMSDEFVDQSGSPKSSNLVSILKSKEMIFDSMERIRGAYRSDYLEQLPGFSHIIEKYLLHKVMSPGIFIRNGFVYGINHLVLCYSFIRLFLLAEIISGKDRLDDRDILEAISFVELIFFHRRWMEYLRSPQMLKILSKPVLSLLLIKL